MIARPSGRRWLALKAEGIQIKRLNESVDRPSWIILIDKVLQARWQKRCLHAIRALDERLMENLPRWKCDADMIRRFHTVWPSSGSPASDCS
jgi:hypothetical protein